MYVIVWNIKPLNDIFFHILAIKYFTITFTEPHIMKRDYCVCVQKSSYQNKNDNNKTINYEEV